MQILLSSLFIILNFYISGSFFANKNAHHNIICKFSLSSIIGAILISFISLLINFFSPINQLIGNIFLILSIIIFFFIFFYFEKNKLEILFIHFNFYISYNLNFLLKYLSTRCWSLSLYLTYS